MRQYLQDDEHTDGKIEGCARDMVQNMWSMMLSLWRKRNDSEHGCDAFYSKADIQTMTEIVVACYDKFSSNVDNNEKWIFKMAKEKRIKETVVSTLGWIEMVESVYVDDTTGCQELKNKIRTLVKRMRIESIFAE